MVRPTRSRGSLCSGDSIFLLSEPLTILLDLDAAEYGQRISVCWTNPLLARRLLRPRSSLGEGIVSRRPGRRSVSERVAAPAQRPVRHQAGVRVALQDGSAASWR